MCFTIRHKFGLSFHTNGLIYQAWKKQMKWPFQWQETGMHTLLLLQRLKCSVGTALSYHLAMCSWEIKSNPPLDVYSQDHAFCTILKTPRTSISHFTFNSITYSLKNDLQFQCSQIFCSQLRVRRNCDFTLMWKVIH